MKNYRLFLFLFILAVSCKKEKQNDADPGRRYPVTFSTQGITQSRSMGKISVTGLTPTDVGGADPASGVNHIYYAVVGVNNGIVKLIHQIRGVTPNFGVIKDNLPAGQYKVGFVACKNALTMLNPSEETSLLAFPDQDMFQTHMALDVAGQINQKVVLERWLGQLEIQAQDEAPYDIEGISFYFQASDGLTYVPGGFNIATGYPELYSGFYRPIANEEKGTKLTLNYFFMLYPGVEKDIDINFTSYDLDHNEIDAYKIGNVKISKGKKTILKGKLFKSGNGAGGVITLQNTVWGDNPGVGF
jgi:hypothetical protein